MKHFAYALLLIITGCSAAKSEKTDSPVSSKKEVIKETIEEPLELLDQLPLTKDLEFRTTPILDSTNFDNFSKENFFSKAAISQLQLEKVYPNLYKEGYNIKITPHYKLKLSDEFRTLVIVTYKGEHELESALINYNKKGEMIDFDIITYDEIAEGAVRRESKVEQNKLTIYDIVWFDEKKVEESKFQILRTGEIAF